LNTFSRALEKERKDLDEQTQIRNLSFPIVELYQSLMFLKSFLENETEIIHKFKEMKVNFEQLVSEFRMIVDLTPRPTNQKLKKLRTGVNRIKRELIQTQAYIDHPDEDDDTQELKEKIKEQKKRYQEKLKELREEIVSLSKYAKLHFPELRVNSSELSGFLELGDILIEDFPMFDLGNPIASSNHKIFKIKYEGETFVLKEFLGFSETDLKKARKEIRILKRLSQHQNIIKFLGVYFDQQKNVIYLKTVYYPSSLNQLIANEGFFFFFFP